MCKKWEVVFKLLVNNFVKTYKNCVNFSICLYILNLKDKKCYQIYPLNAHYYLHKLLFGIAYKM